MKAIPLPRSASIFGFVSLALMTVALTGIRNAAVRSEMHRQTAVADQLRHLRGTLIIADTVTQKQRLQKQITRTLKDLQAELHRTNRRDPLLSGVFPQPADRSLCYAFAEHYRAAVDRLPSCLHPGSLPTETEIQAAQHELAELRAEIDAETGRAETKPPRPPAATRGLPSDSVDARRYACAAKAQGIRCYAGDWSFDVSTIYLSYECPTAAQMWYAQISLWIQQDVVTAIARVNNEAAASHPAMACVEHMPVKGIVAIELGDYFALDEDFDVVVFRLGLVVDQRDALRIIRGICEQNLYICAGAFYCPPSPEDAPRGYLYGADPVVYIDLSFHAYFARHLYRPMMPAAVQEQVDGQSPRQP